MAEHDPGALFAGKKLLVVKILATSLNTMDAGSNPAVVSLLTA